MSLKLKKKIIEIIQKNYNSGTPELINKEVGAILRFEKIELQEGRILQNELEINERNIWSSSKLAKTSKLLGTDFLSLEEQSNVARQIHSTILQTKTGFEKRLINSLEKALKKQTPLSQLTKIVQRLYNNTQHHASTIAKLARAGRNRSQNIRKSIEQDIKYFKYSGPAGSPRKFCAEHFGKIYTLEQINKLQNGFKMPVVMYMGGPNCRHFFTAWVGNKNQHDVFVHDSWQANFDNATKNNQNKMLTELNSSNIIMRAFKSNKNTLNNVVELRSDYRPNKAGITKIGERDIDVFVNGIPSEIKTPKSFHTDTIINELKDAHKANQPKHIYIVLNNNIQQFEEAINNAKIWKLKHSEYKPYIVNKLLNSILEL